MSKKTRTDEALAALERATVAAGELAAAERELRSQHVTLTKERAAVISAHPSEAEILANMNKLVDNLAASFAREHGVGFVRALGGHRESRIGDGGRVVETAVAPGLPQWGPIGTPLSFEDLVGIAPDLAKTRLREIIHSSGARFGLPVAERAQRLAELDQAVQEAEAQHTALVEAAGKVGITLPLLEAAKTAREAEGRAEKLGALRVRGAA
jgi:hypothetical protein